MITIQPHASEKIQHQIALSVLIAEFKQFLPAAAIISEPEALRPFESDGLSVYHCLPWLVVLPETVQQVQRIMTFCYQQGVPVVARGAGTGLAGGAVPLDNGVLLGLSKLNQILEIDSANRLVRVQRDCLGLLLRQRMWAAASLHSRHSDERGFLNPGKAVATLQRCAEFGAMHVHQGKLGHPELERF